MSGSDAWRILGVIAVALIGSVVGNRNMGWYNNPANVKKSPLQPPSFMFSIIWPVLYVLYAWAWVDSKLDWLFSLGIILNLLWSLLFFGAHSYLMGNLVILTILGVSIYTCNQLFSQNFNMEGAFIVAYTTWIAYASLVSLTTCVIDPCGPPLKKKNCCSMLSVFMRE